MYLCSDESATARKQAGAGSNSSHSSLPIDKGVIRLTDPKGSFVVVRKDECYAEMRGFLNPGKQAAEMSAVAAEVYGPDEFITGTASCQMLASVSTDVDAYFTLGRCTR